MSKQEMVESVTQKLEIFDKHVVAKVMASQGLWKAGTSAVNNTYKALCIMVALGKLERGDGFFRVKGNRSKYGKHAKAVTAAIAGYITEYPNTVVYREHYIAEISLRPDALLLLTRNNGGEGRVIYLEVCLQEPPEYFQKKVIALSSWGGANKYLSNLFGFVIPRYEIVRLTEGGHNER